MKQKQLTLHRVVRMVSGEGCSNCMLSCAETGEVQRRHIRLQRNASECAGLSIRKENAARSRRSIEDRHQTP